MLTQRVNTVAKNTRGKRRKNSVRISCSHVDDFLFYYQFIFFFFPLLIFNIFLTKSLVIHLVTQLNFIVITIVSIVTLGKIVNMINIQKNIFKCCKMINIYFKQSLIIHLI